MGNAEALRAKREKLGDPLMDEWHWCPWCPFEVKAQRPLRIEDCPVSEARVLIVKCCDEHGELLHDPHETDCWCLK